MKEVLSSGLSTEQVLGCVGKAMQKEESVGEVLRRRAESGLGLEKLNLKAGRLSHTQPLH